MKRHWEEYKSYHYDTCGVAVNVLSHVAVVLLFKSTNSLIFHYYWIFFKKNCIKIQNCFQTVLKNTQIWTEIGESLIAIKHSVSASVLTTHLYIIHVNGYIQQGFPTTISWDLETETNSKERTQDHLAVGRHTLTLHKMIKFNQ